MSKAAPAITYSISELASEFDLTPRAIRFYEDHGLLEPARAGPSGRIRVYAQRDRTRLKLTLRGKRLGFSLAAIKELLDMYESPRDTGPQLKRFLAVLAEQRVTLAQQRLDIEATLTDMARQEAQCKMLLRRLKP